MAPRAPRVYVTSKPDADIKAIANVSPIRYVGMQDLLVSRDGVRYITVRHDSERTGPGDNFVGTITQPRLGIDHVAISLDGTTMTYDGIEYKLDLDATIGECVVMPIMQISHVMTTCLGVYVIAKDLLTSKRHDFLDGVPLVPTPGHRLDKGIVTDYRYLPRSGYRGRQRHRYVVTVHPDTACLTATFNGLPVKVLEPADYNAVFRDDLTRVTVALEKK